MAEKTAVASPTRAWQYPRAHVFFWFAVAVVLLLDLWTKSLVFRLIATEKTVRIVSGLLEFRPVYNEGAVFGLGEGGRWLFVIATFAAAWFIIQLFAQSRANQRLLHLLLALSLGGAVGNLYDRLVFASVRDFIAITAKLTDRIYVWPYVFNVADVALVIGIGLLLVGWVFGWIELQGGSSRKRAPVGDEACELTDEKPERLD